MMLFSNMLRFLAIGGIFACSFLICGISGQKNVGPGKWSVLNIMKCDKDSMMPMKLDANRRKVNRTHDGFNAKLEVEEEIDDTFGVRLDICKVVDGGCKDYSTMADDSLIKFAKKYAEGNVKTAMECADIDPPDFPVPVGVHTIKSFLFNYDELPPEGPYGEYMACGYLIKDAREVMCAKVHTMFQEVEEIDEEVDEE
ncbi:uncharacterized protein LOC134795062 [Cydia splendana]|uniref:uncharacterized protein LOC134795062 n=1 Tax=Cydia splendana TaxID=1100963 RepID=UPI00212E0EB6